MDIKTLLQNLAEELVREWEISPTGSGFFLATDWRWPNDERIEIYIRAVGEREDLYLVTDGGNLFNFLFAHGVDLRKDKRSMKFLNGIAEHFGAKIVDFQMARGANETDVHQAVRMILEAIKEASFILWHKLSDEPENLH